jgi:dihydrofolate reductase
MRYWETAAEDPSLADHMLEFAAVWNATPKVVCSRTLESVGPNATLLKEGAAEEVTRLKREPGKDLFVGGAGLASALIERDLVDEYRLLVCPVILGDGTPYFPPLEERLDLELVETRTFGSPVVYLRYGRRR